MQRFCLLRGAGVGVGRGARVRAMRGAWVGGARFIVTWGGGGDLGRPRPAWAPCLPHLWAYRVVSWFRFSLNPTVPS